MNVNNEENISTQFANGYLVTVNSIIKNCNKEWHDHPEFYGVKLKTLVSEKETNNRINSLIVSVEEGYSLKEHSHDAQWEMHEIIEGKGIATLGKEELEYKQGVIAVIPNGIKHSVRAEAGGLVLLAKFF